MDLFHIGICTVFRLFIWLYLFSKTGSSLFRNSIICFTEVFKLVRNLTPGLAIRVSDEVLCIRSSVIVSNHLSYLDPILLISLYEKQKTIVKSTFFRVPIFGWMLKTSGYLPSVISGDVLMMQHIEKSGPMPGENLFVSGTIWDRRKRRALNKGAFKIARLCKAPVKILKISNSGNLFRPGKFLFNTCVPINISVELAGEIHPDYAGENFTVSGLTAQVREMMESESEL
ncbi:MAG: lysophospholipid acyltransferase family protein [Desulfobacterales bacterium]